MYVHVLVRRSMSLVSPILSEPKGSYVHIVWIKRAFCHTIHELLSVIMMYKKVNNIMTRVVNVNNTVIFNFKMLYKIDFVQSQIWTYILCMENKYEQNLRFWKVV